MGIIRRSSRFAAVMFDLDEALLWREPAWTYTVEEAVAAVTGRRIDARPLATEYRHRPWRHVLRILLDSPTDIADADDLCRDIYVRSAMKRLLVREGIGMALDILRGASVESGAISRETHAIARRQVESTGLERFVAVLSATPPGDAWDIGARTGDCLRFLEREPARCAFVSPDLRDLRAAGTIGFACYRAAWAIDGDDNDSVSGEFGALEKPDDLARLLT